MLVSAAIKFLCWNILFVSDIKFLKLVVKLESLKQGWTVVNNLFLTEFYFIFSISRGLYRKTYYGRNLRISIMS